MTGKNYMSPEQQSNDPVTANSSPNIEKRSLEQLGQWISTHLEHEPDDIKAVLQKERAWIEQRRENTKIKVAVEHPPRLLVSESSIPAIFPQKNVR